MLVPADPERQKTSTARSSTSSGSNSFARGTATSPLPFADRDGSVYVGSTEDGSVYRAAADGREAEVFLAGGEDGRDAVTGLTVDQGRDLLLVAGRDTGRVFAHALGDGDLVGVARVPGDGRTLVNDVVVVRDAAYVTDSFRPTLYRVALSVDGIGAPEPWLDLDETPVPFKDGVFNLNGITVTPDGSALLTVHYDTGRLFRVDLGDRSVTEVDLGGELLPNGDGIEVDGSTLHAVSSGRIVVADLADDAASGEVVDVIDGDWRFPTTIALRDDDILVVNSQLDMAGGEQGADLPFVVTSTPRPAL